MFFIVCNFYNFLLFVRFLCLVVLRKMWIECASHNKYIRKHLLHFMSHNRIEYKKKIQKKSIEHVGHKKQFSSIIGFDFSLWIYYGFLVTQFSWLLHKLHITIRSFMTFSKRVFKKWK